MTMDADVHALGKIWSTVVAHQQRACTQLASFRHSAMDANKNKT
jgi:hypothetical protein